MAIWFKIKKGVIEAHDADEWSFIKKILYQITFRKYERKYRYMVTCIVNNSDILKVGDIFVAGTETPPIYFIITKKGKNRQIAARSLTFGSRPDIANFGGLSVVVRSAK